MQLKTKIQALYRAIFKTRHLLLPLALCLILCTSAFGSEHGCVGSATPPPGCADSFLMTYPEGDWSSSDPTIASVDAITGEVTGVRAGRADITYTAHTDCGIYTYTYTIYIDAPRDPGVIGGTLELCVNYVSILTETVGGGTWSSSDPAIGDIDASGTVTAIAPGTATISYEVTAHGCPSYATAILTVYALPTAITGSATVVLGYTSTLSDAVAGGTWSSSDVAVATVGSSSGIVSGIATGTAIITYRLPAGCETTIVVTVTDPYGIGICETAPFHTCDSIISYCTGLTVAIDGLPTDATVNWNPSISSHSTYSWSGSTLVYSFSSAPASAVYTVTATSGSYSTIRKIRIVVAYAGHYPCDYFTPMCSECDTIVPFRTLMSKTLDTNYIYTDSAACYFIANHSESDTLRVSPAPGSIFYFDNNTSLSVRSGDDITLDSCHFATWYGANTNGVNLQIRSSGVPKLLIKNNTIFENFLTAVNIDTLHMSYPASGYVMQSYEAIYNHNQNGIYISNTDSLVAFKVVKNVFTNRNLCTYSLPGASGCDYHQYYPFVWPTEDYLQTMTLDTLSPRYNIDAFTKYTDGTTGLILNRVGKTNTASAPYSYTNLIVGDSTLESYANMFDNMWNHGVNVNYSNVVFYNNIFREARVDAIFNTDVDYEHTLQLYGSMGKANRFFNCITGIKCNPCYNLVSRNTIMRAENYDNPLTSSVPDVTKGDRGYDLSGNSYDVFEVGDNELSNLKNAIYSAASCNGTLNLHDNNITGIPSPTKHGYSDVGITVTSCSSSAGKVLITNNRIAGQVTGIKATIPTDTAYINDNKITIIDTDPSITSTTRKGIVATGASLDSICRNEVLGDPTWHSVAYHLPGHASYYRGIEIFDAGASEAKTTVSCNYVHDIESGFFFHDISYLTWTKNVMTRNRYGMVLSGVVATATPVRIGNQGDNCTPSDNYWDPLMSTSDPSLWPGWHFGSDSCYETFVIADTPSYTSILCVRNATGYYPVYNGKANYGTSPVHYGINYADSTASLFVCPDECIPVASLCGPGATPSFPGGGPGTEHTFGRAGRTTPAPEMTVMTRNREFTVFPNPASDNITIKASQNTNEAVNVMVKNYAGASVYRGRHKLTDGSTNIKLPNVAPGMYMIIVTDEHGANYSFKLTVQK